jgi:hypothetical protein
MDDTAQRLLFKIATGLYNSLGFASALLGTGSPVGVVVPVFSGQLYEDTLNSIFYKSTGITSADWVLS